MAEGTLIRDDLEDPVLQFEAETDVGRGFFAARQPDTDLLRTWEVTGTAHADQSILDYNASLSADFGLDLSDQCPVINDGPMAEVLRASVDAMRTWVVDGQPAPEGDPIEDDGGVIARDDLGIALGGIRTPPVDAPVVVLSGDPVPGTSVLCSLFGNMEDIPPAELAELYPTHDDYVAAVTAVRRSRRRRRLPPPGRGRRLHRRGRGSARPELRVPTGGARPRPSSADSGLCLVILLGCGGREDLVVSRPREDRGSVIPWSR